MNTLYTLPEVLVESGGTQLSDDDARALSQVRVQQRLSLPTLCELTFRDPPGPLDGATRLNPGTNLRVLVRGQSVPLFTGQVTAIEYCYSPLRGREVRIRSYDLLHQMRKRQTVRAHVQVTLAELADTLISNLGLSVQAEENSPLWQRVIQHRQSDLELLVELAERCGLYLTLREDILHLISLTGTGDEVPLKLGVTLFEARIEVNGDLACRTVSASGWDPAEVEVYTRSTANPRDGRIVNAEVDPSRVGGSGQRDLVDEATQDNLHAEALAQAELDRRIAHEVTFHGVAEGNPSLRPGTALQVTGLEGSIEGRYVLTSVNHLIDEKMGYVSELSTDPPTLRQRSYSSAATLGIISNVDDPDRRGRVKAKLPTYNDVETDWMGLLTAGAGPDTGLVLLPKVDDQVLILLIHEDPAHGIVLGGLYGQQKIPEGGAIFTLRTRDGQRIQFDDDRKLIRLENNVGSFVELSPDKVQLHSGTGLVIEAPGQAVTIRGKTIDFERA